MKCKEGAIQLIDQIIDTIEVIPNMNYAKPMEVFNGATLGKHFRHIYDFFYCLIDQCNSCQLDYAMRMRNEMIETNPDYTITKFHAIKSRLELLDEQSELSVFADFQLSDGSRPKVKTTVGREIMYAYDHAVHHLAIVKIGLKDLDPQLPINKTIGIAASTIKHQFEMTHGH